MSFISELWVCATPSVTVEAEDGVRCVFKTGKGETSEITLRMSRFDARLLQHLLHSELDDAEGRGRGAEVIPIR